LPDLAPDAFAGALAAEPAIANVRLILMVPAAWRGDASASTVSNFHAKVTKPVRQGELREAIAGVLRYPQAAGEEVRPSRHEATTLGGVRVLLAEDNPVNQDVARTMLESLDCEVHAVDNGRKALAALERLRFDIVLMDCQMPEMDGYDATAEIRARGMLRPRQPAGVKTPIRLPIVALTANAVKGDRETCLAAGMDEHLVKPFRRDALRRVLERWVLDRASSNDAAVVAIDPEEATVHTLDLSMLEQIRRNVRPGAPCPVAGLIDRYVGSTEELIATLRNAAEANDAGGVARSAHSLRSGSAFLGARRLAGMCDELERAVRAGDNCDVARYIDRIAREYEEVRSALNAAR
jgi:CheY-like chemotaxis protein